MRRFRLAGCLMVALIGGWLGGCRSDDQNERMIRLLKEGNFKGHIAVAGKPALLVDWGATVRLGLDATVAADGYVDFSVPAGSSSRPDFLSPPGSAMPKEPTP